MDLKEKGLSHILGKIFNFNKKSLIVLGILFSFVNYNF